jgi:hypothetical protein
MRELWLRCALGVVLLAVAISSLSCMHERKLVSINLRPSGGFSFATPDPAAEGVFTAFGNYIHPPDTRDITARVTWKTDVPQLLVINGGVVSPQPGNVCGIADVTASMSDGGNVVVGSATVVVNDPSRTECPGGNQTKGVVTVALAGVGTGSVTSSPAGITCPSGACGAQFNVGDTIVLTATPFSNGSTFDHWDGCDETNGTTCSVLVQKGSIGLTVTFN